MINPKRLLFLNAIDKCFHDAYFENIKVSSIPLIERIPISFNISELDLELPWVITSKKAAELIKILKLPNKIYTVGPKSSSFFKNSISPTKSSALELAKLIASQKEKKVVFICGNMRRKELPDFLKKHNIEVKEVVVYRTEFVDKNVNLQDYDALAFMSPSSVKAWSLKNSFGSLPCFAIGQTTAKSLKKLGQNCIVSKKPNVASIIEAAQIYFK